MDENLFNKPMSWNSNSKEKALQMQAALQEKLKGKKRVKTTIERKINGKVIKQEAWIYVDAV